MMECRYSVPCFLGFRQVLAPGLLPARSALAVRGNCYVVDWIAPFMSITTMRFVAH